MILTRRMSSWSVAVALMLGTGIAAAQSATAQNAPTPPQANAPAAPAPANTPPQPPAATNTPPPAPPMPVTAQPPVQFRPRPFSPPVAPKPLKPLIGPPGVAATVNGETISVSAVKDLAYKTVGPRLVDQMIDNMLIDQAARKAGLVATPADIDAKIADLRKQIAGQMNGRSLEDLVASSGHTMQDLRDSMKTRVEIEKLVSKNLQPVEAVHVRHILIRTQNVGPADPNTKIHSDADALAIITKIQGDLAAGKSFVDEADQYTEDPSGKSNGGDLPVITPTSPMDPSFLAAAMKLKKGEVTPTPVKSMYGYHLIYCVSTSSDPIPADKPLFDQAEENARQAALGQQAQTYVQTLKSQAKIVNYLANGVPSETQNAKPTPATKKTAVVATKPVKSAKK